MEEQNVKELTITRSFDVPVEKVWRALVDQELVKEWWGPRGVTIPVCEIDARKGGKISITMRAGKELGNFEGQEWPMIGEFDEVIEGKKLVFTSGAVQERESKKMSIKSQTTMTLEEKNGKTKLVVFIKVIESDSSPEAKFALQGMSMGWNQQVDKLGEFLIKR